jgi:hypothetical protein
MYGGSQMKKLASSANSKGTSRQRIASGRNTNSGHEVHKEQPQLVIDSIREVVDAVRDPASWP